MNNLTACLSKAPVNCELLCGKASLCGKTSLTHNKFNRQLPLILGIAKVSTKIYSSLARTNY